jgi:hypothetical protein
MTDDRAKQQLETAIVWIMLAAIGWVVALGLWALTMFVTRTLG